MSAEMIISTNPNEISTPFDYASVTFPTELRETAEAIRKRTAKRVIDNGRDFSRWHDDLERGQFRRWFEGECWFSMRTAELAIMVWKYVEANDNYEIISLLPPTVQYLIAAPTAPQPVRDHVLGCYAKGERLNVQRVKQMLRDAKGSPSEPGRSAGNPILRAHARWPAS